MPRPTHQGLPPVDKGWAWVVAIAIFFERFFTVGVTRSSGLFLLQLVDRYHVTTTYAGMFMTLALTIFAIGAPVATVLGESLTPRRLFMLGGLFSVASMAVSGLVGNLPTIIVTMGFGIGVVNSCCYGNGMVMIGKYFRVQRQMATNVALVGGSLGQMVIPLVVEFLIKTYGLRGSLLIMGALYLQCAVSGALLRPVDVTYQRVGDDLDPKMNSSYYLDDDVYYDKAGDGDDNWSIQKFGKTSNGGARFCKKLKNDKNAQICTSQTDVQEHQISNGSKIDVSPEDAQIRHSFTIPEIIIQTDKDEVIPLPRTDEWHSDLYGGNRVNSRLTVETSKRKVEESSSSGKQTLKNGRRSSFSGSADENILSSTSSSLSTSRGELYYLSDVFDDEDTESISKGSDRSRRKSSVHVNVDHNSLPSKTNRIPKWSTFLQLVFDFSVLKDNVTVLFIFITVFFYLVWHNFVLLLPGVVLEKKIEGYDKPVIISMMGLGDLLARVLTATGSMYCSDNHRIQSLQRYKLEAAAALLGAANTALFIPVMSFPQLVALSFLHGLFGGVFECLIPGVLVDFVGVSKMAQTLGVVLLFQGLAGAVGQPLLGFLKDLTGSYHVVCALCCGSLLISCFLLLVYPVMKKKD